MQGKCHTLDAIHASIRRDRIACDSQYAMARQIVSLHSIAVRSKRRKFRASAVLELPSTVCVCVSMRRAQCLRACSGYAVYLCFHFQHRALNGLLIKIIIKSSLVSSRCGVEWNHVFDRFTMRLETTLKIWESFEIIHSESVAVRNVIHPCVSHSPRGTHTHTLIYGGFMLCTPTCRYALVTA